MLGSARCHARDHNRAKRSASHRLAARATAALASRLWSVNRHEERIKGRFKVALHSFTYPVRDSLIHIDDSNLLNQFIKNKNK